MGFKFIHSSTSIRKKYFQLLFLESTHIILYFIKYLKQTAEIEINQSLDSVVLGRPVHFQDFAPDEDEKAESVLRKIARSAGFKNIAFQ